MRLLKRHVFNFLGWFSFILAVIGAILPIMPTTPFLLLASFFFSKGSPRFHHWLINLRYIGPKIRAWEEHRVIDLRSKVLATLMLLSIALIYVFFTAHQIWVKTVISVTLLVTIVFINTRASSAQRASSTKNGDTLEGNT